MPGRVLVTPRSMTEAGLAAVAALDPLRAAGFDLVATPAGAVPSRDVLLAQPRDVVGWIAGVERIGPEVLDRFPGLRCISRNGAGSDGIDLPAAAARGVRVATARGANARGVAELALLHLLNGLRGLSRADAAMRLGRWERTPGRELPDVTVGIVGLGAVGRILAGLLVALGARVVAHDPVVGDDLPGVTRVGLDDLFRSADVVSLHSPPAADGAPLVGRRQLELLPSGAVLVNTARSSLVDAAAVLDALERGRLSAYGVDAFDEEPPAPTPLLAHPGTALTPHLGAFTAASVQRAAEQAVANLLTILEPPA